MIEWEKKERKKEIKKERFIEYTKEREKIRRNKYIIQEKNNKE